MIAATLISAIAATPEFGNCVSGRYNFNRVGVSKMPNPQVLDWVVDYGLTTGPAANLVLDNGKAILNLVKTNGATAQGIRLSSTRWIKYAKITARLKAISAPGAVTTFITMSTRGDEIDMEIVGKNPNQFESNVFYKGIKEFNVHGGAHPVNNGVASFHEYTFDWKSDSLTWSLDGKVVRTLNRETSISPMTPKGERWFPSTPSQIQMAGTFI
jgi:beta-glucanase (GH16 family)